MAGDWIKMECSTPDKPEVLAITVKLGWDDPDLTVGKLFKLWRWFDQQTDNGNADNVTAALLDRIVGVTGFSNAVASVGWLIIGDQGITLPNFEKHNGKTAKSRANTAKRVAAHKSNAKGNAAGVNKKVNGALPREEKRRDIPPKPPRGDAPLNEIVDLYHEILPELPKVAALNDKRKSQIRARWNQTGNTKSLDWWKGYFEMVRNQPFLMGQTGKDFRADLDFLTTESKFLRVIEGYYSGRQA